jgi:hypothetical protein
MGGLLRNPQNALWDAFEELLECISKADNHGVREVGSAELIGDNDMFRLASMTKAVTSVAAMILIEQGKIGLDDPVSRFLPEFAKLRVRGPDSTAAAVVLEDQHHNTRSAAAFDQSPKGFIKLRVARLGRKGPRHRGGIERERYHSRPEQSDHKTT